MPLNMKSNIPWGEASLISNQTVGLAEDRKTGEMFFTVIAVVVHQDYLFEQVWWRPVDGGVDRPLDDGQGFVHKNEHDAHLREV